MHSGRRQILRSLCEKESTEERVSPGACLTHCRPLTLYRGPRRNSNYRCQLSVPSLPAANGTGIREPRKGTHRTTLHPIFRSTLGHPVSRNTWHLKPRQTQTKALIQKPLTSTTSNRPITFFSFSFSR